MTRRYLAILAGVTVLTLAAVGAVTVRKQHAATVAESHAAMLRRASESAWVWRDYYAASETERAYWAGMAIAYANAAAWIETAEAAHPVALTPHR